MDGFWQSLPPFFKKFGLETIFIFVALIVLLFSFFGFLNQQNNQSKASDFSFEKPQGKQPLSSQNICFVDISGAINKPDVYELPCNKRLIDVIKRAGGISEEADKPFIARNFNFAQYIYDQEKIHVPFTWGINETIFLENKKVLDYTFPQVVEKQSENTVDKISIGISSSEELEVLPGIGKAAAQKIIDNRPYNSINDLIIKKVISKTVFEKIKSYIVE